jgi:hypothetical protein
MLPRLLLLTGLGLIGSGRALPDVIDVSATSSVSGSGYLEFFCGVTTTGCVIPPGIATYTYSFSNGTGTNSVSSSNPSWGPVSGNASVNTPSTLDSLDIDLFGNHTAEITPFYGGNESASTSVTFDLTEASLMQLSIQAFTDTTVTSYSDELLDSHGNVILSPPFGFTNSSTLLAAGSYTWDVSLAGGGMGEFCGSCDQTDFDFQLDATFAPVPTPEPRGAGVGALVALMFGCLVAARRRRIA